MNKQQAINLLKNLEQSLDDYCELNDEGKTAFRMAITALNCSEFPNSSDTISRQQAIDALADMHCKSDEDGYVWIIRSDAWARIDALPSVTPKRKTGKWIVVDDADDSIRISGKCSECGWEAHLYEDDVAGMDYCPNCGARMTEEDV